MDFREKTKLKISMYNLINEEKNIEKNSNILKKCVGLVACFAIVFSGIVYAKDIETYIRKLFNNTNEAIDVAVEEGYVQTENSEYTYDKGIGVKVENLVLDDLNLNISFLYESEIKNVKSLRLSEFKITNDNNKTVFNSKFTSVENLEDLPLYNSFHWGNQPVKVTDTTFSDAILFGLRPEKETFNEIYFDIKSIQVTYEDDTNETVEGNWNFNVIISEEMRENQSVIYTMSESNEYIESCTLTMSKTGAIAEIKSKVDIPRITYEEYGVFMTELICLNADKNKYYPQGIDYNEEVMKLYFEDISTFIEDSDNFELYITFFNTFLKLKKYDL